MRSYSVESAFHPCDEAVIATNDDASDCKRCAVRLGYWKDEYIGYFVRSSERKAPEINRGYFARVKGVEMCVEKFLKKTNDKCQIINLGCGFDTLYWRLKDSGHNIINYTELDFPTVTARKCYTIKRNKALLGKIHAEDGEVKLSPTDMHGPNYHIMGVDLRNIDELDNKLQQAEIDYKLPTIFIAECVLVYIEAQNCRNLLKWLAGRFESAVFVNFEQVNMNDRFGDVMLNNLRARGCSLAGIDSCLSLETQTSRFLECGWSGSRAWDMVQVYQSISPSERQRIEHIEMLDETELLTQLSQHYCLAVAWVGELFQDIEITVEKRMSSLNID
ncbi:leucine carboxyl methyltransferase 1 [Condylostylus longicornis]|uniref:leucine carboxyl methyltransferase 1 n=1 Tax=Condylostylus longicornis TaxID=2530218 RepID=UPI00244E2FCA|nr:leucine carboxyl methyltransferase 1 [Condylostylus longicornis]XP_055376594.1 leucine carboxyl methyltransferase 1 [Condylostylus longicornis]XP_055376595.1 leucine carboxyl methyltransferase 1 [Condylostylus longicornis]